MRPSEPTMHDQPTTNGPNRHGSHVPHERHDLELVVAYAADDLDGSDRADAQALVDGCPDCALLVSDLRAIAAATVTLPTPPRRRDFRLSPEDARRARGWSARRLFDRVGLVPSLGAGLAAIGLAGLLLASIPGSGAPSFGAATTESLPGSAAGAAAAPGAVAGTAIPAPLSGAAPASSSGATAAPLPDIVAPGGVLPSASAAPSAAASAVTAPAPSASARTSKAAAPQAGPSTPLAGTQPLPGSASATSGGPSPLADVSLGAIVVGIVLLVLGFVRRRRSLV